MTTFAPLRSFALSLGWLAMAAAPAVASHPYGVTDWQTLRSASPVAVAPDGTTVLYNVTAGQATGPTKTEWFTIHADGSRRTKLTLPKDFHPSGFTTGAGELYGTTGTKTEDQLARWTIGAKAVRILTHLPGGVSQALIAPDGKRFALAANPQAPDPQAKIRTVVENERTALYVVDADGTHGAWWCPGHDQLAGFAWSHDATRIALLQQTPKLGYHSVSGAIDICTAGATTPSLFASGRR